jgi:hypothetical protein
VSLFDVELNTAMVVAPEVVAPEAGAPDEVAPKADTSSWEVA